MLQKHLAKIIINLYLYVKCRAVPRGTSGELGITKRHWKFFLLEAADYILSAGKIFITAGHFCGLPAIKYISALVASHSIGLLYRVFKKKGIDKNLNSDLLIIVIHTFNPIAYGGRGRFLSHTTIVLAATLKPLKLWLPNFVTSCFYLFATI